MQQRSIFVDPSGARSRWFHRGTRLLALLLTLTMLTVALTVSLNPPLPATRGEAGDQALHPACRNARLARNRALRAATRLAHAALGLRRSGQARSVAAAYYVPWNPASLASLKAHADRLTHCYGVWLHLDANGKLDSSDFDGDKVREACGIHPVRLVALLNNFRDDAFRSDVLARMTPAAQAALCQSLVDFVARNRLAGLQLDLENLDPRSARVFEALLARLHPEFARRGWELSCAAECSWLHTPGLLSWEALRRDCDYLVLMAYDEHWPGSAPGPIASLPFVQSTLTQALGRLPADHWVMGCANYAYDWPEGQAAGSESYGAALAHLNGHAEDLNWDSDSSNPTFNYRDPEGKAHEVWMLDAATAANSYTVARPLGLRGSALWSLGSEDPGIWSFWGGAGGYDPVALRQVEVPDKVTFEGQGEVLQVASEAVRGERALDINAASLITDENYTRLPSPPLLRRSGYHPKELALTFDDGPQPGATEAILDVLRRHGVHATFFLIGENCEKYPELVQRIYAEGHDIGSHSYSHPNLGEVSDSRIRFELNLTQRLLQALTGHSTLLFRPPYNADAEPTTPAEVHPIEVASKLGYLTVAESLDPRDWQLTDGDGTTRQAPEIVAEALAELKRQPDASCLLLHDGGGDRSETAAALDSLILHCQKLGYRLVSTHKLLGMGRAQVMPAISQPGLWVDRVFFLGWSRLSGWLTVAFEVAVALGLLRALLLLATAVWARSRERQLAPVQPGEYRVSVLIAAYNEARVINSTLRSVLASSYPIHEIVVVDDGSSDGTAAAVEAEFPPGGPVRVIRQANGGKATALNRALDEARGDICFCFDADTVLDPNALARLLPHFRDSQVAAVAGNVKVGNRGNLFTLWQALEYTTAQNLERRAYGALNAITVVPGAIGAWRLGAVRAAGGYAADTLAEDMDLTMRLRRLGWRLVNEPAARAYTEAPDSLPTLFRQRFRWAYGSLQCLWKHRGALGHHGAFGCIVLPSMWVFQVLNQLLSPLVDLQVLGTLALLAWTFLQGGSREYQPVAELWLHARNLVLIYAALFSAEFAMAWVALGYERESRRGLLWLWTQRLVYRQLMYWVVLKSVWRALGGVSAGWNKLERKGTVALPESNL